MKALADVSDVGRMAKHFSRPAVRNGDLYCAPWCDCGCTWAAYELATRAANELVELLGPGWQPHVWENAGWHYEAVRGVVEIRPEVIGDTRKDNWRVVGYKCWIQTKPQYISVIWATPALAMREAMGMMKAAFDQLADSFHETYAIGQQAGVTDA